MTRRTWPTIAWLAGCLLWPAALVLAEEPLASVKAPAVAKVSKLVVLDATGSKGDDFLWESTSGESFEVDSSGKKAYFVAESPGKYRFLFVAAGTTDGKTRMVKALTEIVVDGNQPTPPPGPTPSPTPTPVPVPPVPSTVGNLRVLIVYESSANMPAGQMVAIYSLKVQSYLNAKCLDDGGLPAWRFWDKDVDASRETATWQGVWTQAKGESTPVPKVLIFAGTTLVKSTPLPSSESAMLELLQSFGGPK